MTVTDILCVSNAESYTHSYRVVVQAKKCRRRLQAVPLHMHDLLRSRSGALLHRTGPQLGRDAEDDGCDSRAIYRPRHASVSGPIKPDSAELQSDLKKLEVWKDEWRMAFDQDKCNTITICRNINNAHFQYTLHNQN